MKIMLVSERPEFLAALEPMIASLPSVSLIGAGVGDQAAGEAIALTRPDAVVLDLRRGSRALSYGDWILAPDRPELIVIGADSAAACEAFDLDAAGFVQEPVALEHLGIAFARANRRLTSQRNRQPSASSSAESSSCGGGVFDPDGTDRVWALDETIRWVAAAQD